MAMLMIIDNLNAQGIELSIEDFYDCETVADLTAHLNSSNQHNIDEDSEISQNPIETEAVTSSTEKKTLSEIVLSVCREVLEMEELTEDESLFDAGVNSMAMLMIIDNLNAQGIELSIEDFYDCEAVKDLVDVIEHKVQK